MTYRNALFNIYPWDFLDFSQKSHAMSSLLDANTFKILLRKCRSHFQRLSKNLVIKLMTCFFFSYLIYTLLPLKNVYVCGYISLPFLSFQAKIPWCHIHADENYLHNSAVTK